MQYKDYYKIMGLERSATAEDIKRAYRKLARKYHPDVSKEKDAEARFKEIGEAYAVLSEPEKRAAYDQLGSNWQAGENFRKPPEWNSDAFYGEHFSTGAGAQFSDFFESLFGGGRARTRGGRRQSSPFGASYEMPGQDLHAKITISLEDAYRGATRTIQLPIPEVDSQGVTRNELHTLKVKIPAGVTSGQQIRLAGQGAPGFDGGPNGDLYLAVELEPHPQFRVEGRDVYTTLPITPWEAALGATVLAPTLGGNVELKIPTGSQSGQKMRLKGRGLPGKQPGDQYLLLQIVVPPADTPEKREFYTEMSKKFNFQPRKL